MLKKLLLLLICWINNFFAPNHFFMSLVSARLYFLHLKCKSPGWNSLITIKY